MCPLLLGSLPGPAAAEPPKKRVLALGDTSTRTYQHAAISHALATIERLGRQSGLYDTWIRTDTQLVTKQKSAHRNLADFDAIFFYSIGELPMSDAQKADLLSFVREDGKGFVAAHTWQQRVLQLARFRRVGGRPLRRSSVGTVRRSGAGGRSGISSDEALSCRVHSQR